MRTKAAVDHFGGVKKLADALGIGRAAIYQWGEFPPVDRQCHIEVLSGGALLADGVARPADEGLREERAIA